MFFPHLPNGLFLWCRLCALRMFLAMSSEEIIDCVEVELAEATLVRIEQDCRQSVLTNCSPETLLRKGSIRACRLHLLSPALVNSSAFFLVKLSYEFSAFTTKHISWKTCLQLHTLWENRCFSLSYWVHSLSSLYRWTCL